MTLFMVFDGEFALWGLQNHDVCLSREAIRYVDVRWCVHGCVSAALPPAQVEHLCLYLLFLRFLLPSRL